MTPRAKHFWKCWSDWSDRLLKILEDFLLSGVLELRTLLFLAVFREKISRILSFNTPDSSIENAARILRELNRLILILRFSNGVITTGTFWIFAIIASKEFFLLHFFSSALHCAAIWEFFSKSLKIVSFLNNRCRPKGSWPVAALFLAQNSSSGGERNHERRPS